MKDTFITALDVVQTLSAILVFLIGIGILVVIVMYIVDVSQTEHAIRRNFPVIWSSSAAYCLSVASRYVG